MKRVCAMLIGILFLLLTPTAMAQTQEPIPLFFKQHIRGNVAIPDSLKPLIMQYYPQVYIDETGNGHFLECEGSTPIQDDLTNGRIQCWEHELSANGPDIYIVTYCRCEGLYGTRLRIFSRDSAGGFHYSWGANPDVGAGTYWDPHFADLDKDGTDELVLYWGDDQQNTGAYTTGGVLVLAYRNGALVPITPYSPQNGSVIIPGPPAPGSTDVYTCTCSDTDVGFVDIDGDGILELLVYPEWANTPDNTDRVWVSGTEVWKLVNGVYKFQYETPIGTSTPSGGVIGAAIKPASIPLSEMEGAGAAHSAADSKGQGGGNDRAITLYVMPPSGYTLNDVDWTSLRIADFSEAATADEGVDPAPYNSSAPPPSMMPVNRLGQTMLQEDLPNPDMAFTQKDKDPVYYIGPSGKLHFTTPYHLFGFSKTALLPWLYAQWQSGASASSLTTCVSPGANASGNSKVAPGKQGVAATKTESQGNSHCFTPITIPIRVNLTNNRGPAFGEARIWIEAQAKPASAAPSDLQPNKGKT